MSEPPPSRPAVDVSVTVTGAPSPRCLAAWVETLIAGALPPRRARAASLSLLVCGDARMRSLNRRHMGEDRPTDVLSFPSGEADFLGDLAIDLSYAARQAARRGHPVEREVQALLAHGLLHLLGHDHETDDGEMFRLQRRLVRAAFGPGPDGVPEEAAGRRGRR